jgi:squalene-hopene/tetraprenyl-beta-curcumene cyclase
MGGMSKIDEKRASVLPKRNGGNGLYRWPIRGRLRIQETLNFEVVPEGLTMLQRLFMRQLLRRLPVAALALACCAAGLAAKHPVADASKAATANDKDWDKAAAAKYLDARQAWWQEWPHAQKDHGTVCVSCHTQVPYALARPALRHALGESAVSDPERAMLDSILTRVKLGNEAATFYSDAEHGPGKTKEARNAEAVNNALILAAYDAAGEDEKAGVHETALKAFDAMWALQEKAGPAAGAWVWQDFHFSPWEAPESEYYGAAMAAVAVGIEPGGYGKTAAIQGNLDLLRGYLKREEARQPLMNRVALLWASAKMPGLMTAAERDALAAELKAKQHADGGWSLTELGLNAKGESSWKRHDATAFDTRSDGYATGLVVLALEENGLGKVPETARGIEWILANQDKADGRWPAWSVNVKRDPESNVGKFMSDAATGFSILALERRR